MTRLAPELYAEVKRKPVEGTITDAIKCHSQACGFVAYALNLTPDQVAQEVSLNDVTNGKTNEGTNE